jgi:hypothetical protein
MLDAMYWGTFGRYIKANQVLGLVEAFGKDFRGLLSESFKEDSDTDDAETDATEALLNEVIARSDDHGEFFCYHNLTIKSIIPDAYTIT